MTDLTIRSYFPSNLEACRSLWAELVQRHRDLYHDPTIGGENPGLAFDQHLAKVGSERIWVAESAGTVVGFTSLIVSEQMAEVEPLIVTAGQRGQGIGRALLEHAIGEAQRLGIQYLSARPVARNYAAISLVYHAGLRSLGQIEMFMVLDPAAPGEWKPGLELFGFSFEY